MTTNYYSTLIQVAEDCPAKQSFSPPVKPDNPTIAEMQFSLLSANPYEYTSDDLLFECYSRKNNISYSMRTKARVEFFAKSQACLRASPLPKKYGWGIHHNEEGKLALVAMESEQYTKFLNDPSIKSVKAMRSKRK